MTDYTKTAARADASLRRKGGIVVLRQIVAGEYDPDLGTAPTTTTEYEGTGVKIGYSAEDIDGTLIQSGDQKLLLSPLQRNGAPMLTPTTADLVLIGGASFTIVAVDKTEPVDVAVLFTLQLRGL
ncbi:MULTISPECIES: hypothetical protein [unclassified Janthinobacterium]|uniref:hypothetical protein n=1 Tax=unclassified Janthinobacterium TaxID=2610881 RepID=UPI001611CD85|nr:MULTISPECIES: hypothetical protein [unclassified Janthinobacterium]MBB5610432.1 hypothetical protein [Janthinobacterium sp. S3T4]MBB5615731.1 hypothetical protein [Janthinobacterium sp. S3M3]